MKLVLLLLASLLASGANADNLRTIAVLTLMGDTLTLVNHRPETGSNIDRNLYSSVPTSASAIGNMLATEVIEAAQRVGLPGNPELQVVIYPGQYEAPRWITGAKFTPPAELALAMTQSKATHLLLITPYRAPSMLKIANSSIGSGHLEGLGFYIDRELRIKRADTGEVGQGVLALFAYFKVWLIDLASGEPVHEQAITASSTLSVARNKYGLDPWDTLDAAQKILALRRLIRSELDKALPKLLP